MARVKCVGLKRKCGSEQCCIVYHENYNISAFGIEKLHPFDSFKWKRVIDFLKEWNLIKDSSIISPDEPNTDVFLKVHSPQYLKSLRNPYKAASIVEVFFVVFIPPCVIESRLLKPMRLQVGGTIEASYLALTHQWAINVGGGFHHASAESGGGFCFYADITIALKMLFDDKLIEHAIIVDVDAHQGNGHETDFAEDDRVYIFDMFNPSVYPHDDEAKRNIDMPIYVDRHTTDESYLSLLRKKLSKSLELKKFDIMIYNAGTDCLDGDPIGGLCLSPQCIISRDETVFELAKSRNIPIVMLTSGGYQKNNAYIIARSIENLNLKNFIELKCE
ncbi:unnamed protein product [Caenorhabditis bovis]|uniref:Histone deacetylase 11 n=1 Tax=Caenorhabditis bovis TaxID=2654633 RepID=A0A8S1EAZ7_9PELO|nr:unnamed protein product [Caenorhabditis bovis]